jgi:predicted transcriptional regulator YdeE
MVSTIVWRRTLKIVGVELPEAGSRTHLIPLAWASFLAKAHLITRFVRPHILYGVWRRPPEAESPSYLVGVEVPDSTDVPAGLVAYKVPEGRFAVLKSEDDPAGSVTAYELVMSHSPRTGDTSREALAFEIYDTSREIADEYDVPVYIPVQ